MSYLQRSKFKIDRILRFPVQPGVFIVFKVYANAIKHFFALPSFFNNIKNN